MPTRYRWPIVLGGIALALFILASWNVIQGFGGWSTSLTGPGSVTIQIPEAGAYRLWHESKTTIEGRLQVLADDLPAGTVIAIQNNQGGVIPLEPILGTLSQEWEGRRRVAVGRIDIPQAGPHTISITGFDQPRRFQLTEIRFLEHVLRALGLGLIGTVLATIALIQLIVQTSRKADRASSETD